MKFFIVFSALFAVALAASGNSQEAELGEGIIRYENNNIGVEGYKYDVATADGSSHSEEGVLTNIGKDGEGLSVHGQYSYVGPDGVTYTVNYVADENGFQPQGAHLPTGPN